MSEATTSTTPSLEAVLLACVYNWVRSNMFAGWMPGRIHSYDEGTRKANVEILIKDVEERRDGTRSVDDFGIISDVPILFPGRAGAFEIWTPQAGDHVLLLPCARSIDRFLQTGDLTDPDDLRMYDINDMVAIPVARYDFAHTANNDPQIKHTGTQIQIGGSDALALNAKLAELKTAIQNTVVVAQDGGASFKSTLLAALSNWPGNGTTKLKGG